MHGTPDENEEDPKAIRRKQKVKSTKAQTELQVKKIIEANISP